MSKPSNITKLTIPQIRERMYALARRLYDVGFEDEARELRWLAQETQRKPSLYPPTPRRRAPMSEEKRDRIRAYKAAHPDVSLVTIGTIFKENIGRISEAINGYRAGHSTDPGPQHDSY
jgi:hypothetical protein